MVYHYRNERSRRHVVTPSRRSVSTSERYGTGSSQFCVQDAGSAKPVSMILPREPFPGESAQEIYSCAHQSFKVHPIISVVSKKAKCSVIDEWKNLYPVVIKVQWPLAHRAG